MMLCYYDYEKYLAIYLLYFSSSNAHLSPSPRERLSASGRDEGDDACGGGRSLPTTGEEDAGHLEDDVEGE